MYKSINMKKIIILLITITFIGCDQTSQNAGFVLNDDEKSEIYGTNDDENEDKDDVDDDEVDDDEVEDEEDDEIDEDDISLGEELPDDDIEPDEPFLDDD